MYIQTNPKRTFIGKFEYKDDLLKSLTDFCKKEKIKLGVFNLVGAVTKAKLGYYDQEAKKYVYCLELEKKMEIASCMGNISLKDGEITVHCHITLADLEGNTYGGHLLDGAEIFAAEFFIQELEGVLHRGKDETTGLPLWIE